MVFQESFDMRPNILNIEVKPDWPEDTKRDWQRNQESIITDLLSQYGKQNKNIKLQNFLDIGPEPMSIISYHNQFFRECKSSFIMCNYYPALMGACALGERILNHMILKLRAYHKTSEDYKKVHDKKSFNNWILAINTLDKWEIFVEGVPNLFSQLHDLRNSSIHFNDDLEKNTRISSLKAIKLIQKIIEDQFGSRPAGNKDWFIKDSPGYSFIKKEYEKKPFIKEFYLPSTVLVGPNHQFIHTENHITKIIDKDDYENKEISDEEFILLLKDAKKKRKKFNISK